jgi:hypothetical protein
MFQPGAQSSGSQSQKDGTDQFAERRRIDWLQLVLIAVSQIMSVQGGTWQTHTFGRLVIINEPLNLKKTMKLN